MNELMANLEPVSLLLGGLLGLLVGLIAVLLVWRMQQQRLADQSGALAGLQATHQALEEQRIELRRALDETGEQLQAARNAEARLETRLQEKESSYQRQLQQLNDAEKRLTESFQNIAGRLFEDRSKKFSELSQQQMEGLLKPLKEQLDGFNKMVTDTSRQEAEQHAALREKLGQLENLNRELEEEARNLTRALTRQSKAQGSWGEQQLERLLEMAGLTRGEHFATQVSYTTETGSRVQPDVILKLPEDKTIVMDAKVSLVDWTRYSNAEDEDTRSKALAAHLASLKRHIDSLSEKRYQEVPELNALNFVLMFVPIEAAVSEAAGSDPGLAEYALERQVALVSPANLLVTLRTVASVWQVHTQNTYARSVAERAGHLYNKFAGLVKSLQEIGNRLDQARRSWDGAMGQLHQGPGNLLRQIEMLSDLGIDTAKKIDPKLLAQARGDSADESSAESEPADNGDENPSHPTR